MVLAVLLILSGTFMAFYYSPVPGVAYDSVDFALYNLPFGDIIKGIHHYSWNLLLVVLGLHLLRGFVFGAYKAPRQWVWISGVFILLMIPALASVGRSVNLPVIITSTCSWLASAPLLAARPNLPLLPPASAPPPLPVIPATGTITPVPILSFQPNILPAGVLILPTLMTKLIKLA